MKIDERNYQLTDAPRIPFSENVRSITFSNPKKKPCYMVSVDGGVFTDAKTVRCDKLLIVSFLQDTDIDNREQEHYVELKGTDVKHGISQLSNTITLLTSNHPEVKRFAYIVCRSVPKQISTHLQTQKMHFKTKLKCTLVVKELY